MASGTSGLKAGKLSSALSVSAGNQAVWRRRRRNLPIWMKGRSGKQRWPGEDGDTGKQDKGQRSKPEAVPGTLEEKPVSTSPASTCCLLDVANLVAQEASKQHPPAVARIIPHHLLSSRGDTDLRIRGCQLQMNHSLHLPNRIRPETK